MQLQLTIIISYYKAPDNLKLILLALNEQSSNDFEVIISEDDHNEETKAFVELSRPFYRYPIHHIFQERDDGFRKNIMLNRSLLLCKTALVAFIDGDCIPHRNFVSAYIKNTKDGCFLSGRSVMLGENISATIKKNKAIPKLSFISLLLSDSKKIKEAIYWPFLSLSIKNRGLVGRNWGIKKKYLMEVNGFDEDYVYAGVGEDVDIEWRLLAYGLKRVPIKNKAIVYHIYHPRTYSQTDIKKNYDLLHEKRITRHVKCLNGIEKIGKL
jgi:GT2 family glycosyltransferase